GGRQHRLLHLPAGTGSCGRPSRTYRGDPRPPADAARPPPHSPMSNQLGHSHTRAVGGPDLPVRRSRPGPTPPGSIREPTGTAAEHLRASCFPPFVTKASIEDPPVSKHVP